MSQITIDPDGQIRFVNEPALAEAYAGQQISKQRASHVEPANRILRGLFRLLRAHSRDDGPVAAFTRHWPCRWTVAICDGPSFGPFRQRHAAIAAEIEWLQEHRL